MNQQHKKLLLYTFLFFFLLLVGGMIAAYRSTHYNAYESSGSTIPVFTMSRTLDTVIPDVPFRQLTISGKKAIDCWHIEAVNPKGVVVVAHGYMMSKALMLPEAMEFLQMGYSVYLFNFMGAGQSEGDNTSIGFYEAEQMAQVYEFVNERESLPTVLFGVSMGAASILKAVSDIGISPRAIILECPFGTFSETVTARFHMRYLPAFPLAPIITYFMGYWNNFDAFSHNPIEYARSINMPVLLMSGALDPKVSLAEIDTIYTRLPAKVKRKHIFSDAEHESYAQASCHEWQMVVERFLSEVIE